MIEYDRLVEQNQSGKIDDLEFLLEQPELAEMYVQEIQEKGITPTGANAREWIVEFENTHLYQ